VFLVPVRLLGARFEARNTLVGLVHRSFSRTFFETSCSFKTIFSLNSRHKNIRRSRKLGFYNNGYMLQSLEHILSHICCKKIFRAIPHLYLSRVMVTSVRIVVRLPSDFKHLLPKMQFLSIHEPYKDDRLFILTPVITIEYYYCVQHDFCLQYCVNLLNVN
jgi:hypothetical protein